MVSLFEELPNILDSSSLSLYLTKISLIVVVFNSSMLIVYDDACLHTFFTLKVYGTKSIACSSLIGIALCKDISFCSSKVSLKQSEFAILDSS